MENVSTRLLFENVFVASPESLQLKYSLAETADNMQNLTQIQIALNLAILPNKTMPLKIVLYIPIHICNCTCTALYLTQIQIALNLAISPEHNNGKAAQVVSCLKDTPPLRIFCIKLSSK